MNNIQHCRFSEFYCRRKQVYGSSIVHLFFLHCIRIWQESVRNASSYRICPPSLVPCFRPPTHPLAQRGFKMNEENEKKNVTLHLNCKLYNEYSEHCKKEGIVLSRQIEKFIEKELKK